MAKANKTKRAVAKAATVPARDDRVASLPVIASEPLRRKGRSSDQSKSSSAIQRIIDVVSKSGKMQRQAAAQGAVLCVIHALKYGDCTPATKLHNALGALARTNALKKWFETFGPFIWTKGQSKSGADIEGFKKSDAKFKELVKHVADDKSTDAYVRELSEKNFFEWDKEPTYRGLNFLSLVAQAIKRADSEKGKHPDKLDMIDLEGLDEVRIVVGKLLAKRELDKAKVKEMGEAMTEGRPEAEAA